MHRSHPSLLGVQKFAQTAAAFSTGKGSARGRHRAPCSLRLWQLGIATLGAFRDELGCAAEMAA